MKKLGFLIIVLFGWCSLAQESNFATVSFSVNPQIEGTLEIPKDKKPVPLVIIIADTGPTDRDGNQNFQKHSALKKLAAALVKHDIASFRYDKRIVKQIRWRNVDPNLSFDHFVDDAKSVISHFASNDTFSDIYILGHGQGSLVGMLASNEDIAGFISIGGSAKPIDEVITDQVALMDSTLIKPTNKAFSELKKGKQTRDYPQALESIFNLETQPFMINWMSYNPQVTMKNMTIPSLIINGTKDLQVSVNEAELLKNAASNAQLRIIHNMNHVLFHIEGDELENSKSYNESFRPIAEELVDVIVEFITD